MNVEKLQKMAGTVRTGGKGTVRRQVVLDSLSYQTEMACNDFLNRSREIRGVFLINIVLESSVL